MGSETEAQAPAPEPVMEPIPESAASGGGKGLIIAVAVIAVVAIVVIAFMFMGGSGSSGLEGQWTMTGGTYSTMVVMNNDTANTTWSNGTIPASTEVIDFDDDASMDNVTFEDLGNGEFRITGLEMGTTSFTSVEGTYEIDGDTMTATIEDATVTINDPMMGYMEITMDVTYHLTKV